MSATIDDVKAFWNARPCNIRHSREPIGTRKYFDEVAARKRFVEPHIAPFAQFDRWKGKRVLEIGCGIGTDTISFAKAGASVTAVDLSDESLKLCTQRVKVYGFEDQVKVVQADCEELSKYVEPEPYDLIYSFGVIHHTPDPSRAIQEMTNYTTAQTELKLMLYAKYSIKSLQMLLSSITCEAQPDVPVAYTYTRRKIKKLLAPSYKLVSARKDHIFRWSIPEYIQRQYKEAWPWRWMPFTLFHALERKFGWHWLIDGKLKER